MIKAIIFDLDGVLIQSELPTFKLIQKILRKYGFSMADELYKKRIGKKIKPFFNEVYPTEISEAKKRKIVEEFNQEYIGNITKYIIPILSTVNFIKDYQGSLRFGLASVSSREEIDKILKNLNIYSCFSSIISADNITHLKPNPEIYIKAADQLGVALESCVAIEDSIVGVQSAIQAGMGVHVLLNGDNSRDDFRGMRVDGFINSEKDLCKLIS